MVVFIPVAIGAAVTSAGILTCKYVPALIGFSKVGIVAGKTAAGMMSAAAIANGGGVAAGGLVAVLQSVGAAGIGTTGYAVSAGIGAASGYLFRNK